MEYNIQNNQNKGFFNRLLRNLSSLGMNYNNEIARNTLGFGKNEDPHAILADNVYDVIARRATTNVLSQKDIPYLKRDYLEKQRILFEYSTKTEINIAIERIADECIVYNEKDFCSIKPLSREYPQEVHDKYQEVFEDVYYAYGFNNNNRAWHMMRNFLISGYKTYQMIWDDKKTKIISFQEMASETIIPQYDAYNNLSLWFQYPDNPNLMTPFLDSQIVHISYSNASDMASVMSYTEGLIKPYNQLKILEQTRIMFNVINASVHQKFTVPIQGLSKQNGQQLVAELVAEYHESIEWDDTLGTLSIKGQRHLPFNKQYWFPEGENGSPNIEMISPEGHNLNESDILSWFDIIYKKATRIPLSRYDDQGGGNIYNGDNELTRDAMEFNKFINRIRSMFKELIVKPIKLMMCVEFPEYAENKAFLNDIDIIFNQNELFEEWKQFNILEKKAKIISDMMAIERADGSTFLDLDFVAEKLANLLTPEQMAENERYKQMAKARGQNSGGSGDPNAGGGDFGGTDGDFSGGEDFGGDMGTSDDFGGDDIGTDTGGDSLPDDTGGDTDI